MKRLLVIGMLCLAAVAPLRSQNTGFSQDSAYAALSVLVNDIGPRPMGSPAEQKALQFAAAKFAQYGCQESYVMPISSAAGVNTSSGVAVGILRGRTGRIVVIGGHIDSSGPEIPGADDDGSGSATVIELARVLGKKEHESTVVFCCWGGEEEGLRGSEFFVEHFPRIDSVALMLQIDMADGSGELQADPDAGNQVSAPRWLVEAAFDIFYNDLKYEGLIYPTQAATLNSSLPEGSAGSDHMPFLKKGIPAIDFTTDVSYPIHTPLDNWANFTPSGLARSGDLVLKLFERFDGGVPSQGTEKYWLILIGHTPYFFSHLLLRIFAVVAVVLGAVVLFVVRKRRAFPDPSTRVKWSSLKLLLYVLVIQSFMWLSENVVGLFKGLRYPWVNNFGGYVVFAVFCGLLGLWLMLRTTKRLPLSAEPYGYYLRAFILLLALTVLFSVPNAELGAYPAISLFLLAAAMWVRPPLLKALLVLLVPVPMIRLVFMEYLVLFQRMMVMTPMGAPLTSLLYNAGFVLFFSLLSLPFVYAFAAVYRDARADLFFLKKFQGRAGLLLAASGVIVMFTVLLFHPVFDNKWQSGVRVQQTYTLGSDSGAVIISSGEYLNGLRLSYDNRDTVLAGRHTECTLQTARPAVVPWLSVQSGLTAEKPPADTLRSFTRRLELHSAIRPLAVNVSYRSSEPFSASSPWVSGGRRRMEQPSPRSKTFSWYAFPDTLLIIPVTFALRDTQAIRETIEVTYDTVAYPILAHRDQTYLIKRTIVTSGTSFQAPEQGR